MDNYNKLEEAKRLITEVQEALGEPTSPIPVPEDQLVWKNGNLWKPEGDHSNNLVILLRADWPKPDKVLALDDSDSWELLTYTGQSNPDRYTYRGSKPGKDYRGRRAGGGVRVYWGGNYGFIPLTGPARERWD